MDRLTINKRQKTTGDKIDCIPAGDSLPIWETIPLDAKLPMMSNPKGSVLLYTTKLGEPKHQCRQECDFDLRDPNGQYVCNEYQPLHDPHLRSHFNTSMMRRHLIKKGFISEDGKVLCTLKEFNQYRQYLRHIFFLEIARERKIELERRLEQNNGQTEVQRKVSRGTIVRKRLQQQKERDLTKLKTLMDKKSTDLESRLRDIREEMARREQKQRQEAERRQYTVHKHQQENEQRKLQAIKQWHQRDRMKRRLVDNRDTQRKIKAELKCMAKWNARKNAQKEMLKHYDDVLKEDEDMKTKNISRRDSVNAKKWDHFDKKLEKLKQKSREEKQKKDEHYLKRLNEKLASGDYRIYSRKKDRRRSPKKTFHSTWKLSDVLSTFEVPEQSNRSDPELLAMLNAAIDDAVDIVTHPDQDDDEEIKKQARNLVQNVISKVKNDIYPQYLSMIDDDDMKGENEAIRSKSVRFSSDEEEIKTDLVRSIDVTSNDESLNKGQVRFKPVSEHVLTPCASQLEVTKLEAEAILGSPEVGDKVTSISFVETLLLRLLDDLNSGRLSKDDIMKLASYSMDIIQSTEQEANKDSVIVEVPEENESDGPFMASSSCSVIAKKMVDFTLSKILSDIQDGNIHHDDLASLTVSFMENLAGDEGTDRASDIESELDAYIEDTMQRAATAATDPRENSPVCDALLDDFMVVTLKALIKDLEEEILTKEQLHALATSVKEETRQVIPTASDTDVKDREDIQNVLHTVLSEIQSGTIEFQKLYHVVSAIVYSYNVIRAPSDPYHALKITCLLRDVLHLVEQKASSFDDLNLNIVHEANRRLSKSNLDSKQVEELSASVASVVAAPEICSKEQAISVVEEALSKAKIQIEKEETDAHLRQSVMEVAEAVINTLTNDRESPVVDVFVDVLKHLKTVVDVSGGIDDLSGEDIVHLIQQISQNEIQEDAVLEMAQMVARVVRSPIQSDSSFAASLAVHDGLKVALNDIKNHNGEDAFVKDILVALRACCNAAQHAERKTPAFLRSLADLLRHILDHLTLKIQTGELTDADVSELTSMIKQKTTDSESKGTKTKSQKTIDSSDPAHMLQFINDFIDAASKGELNTETAEAKDIGHRLIQLGERLVGVFGERPSIVETASTDHFVENVVEDIIRNIKIEIESGLLSTDSLKEVTKAIIETASVTGSASASTVASHIVHQTIDSITKEISLKGIPRELISSIAMSVVTALVGDEQVMGKFNEEFAKFTPTIINIIDCLKKDEISHAFAEDMFCLILKHYNECVGTAMDREDDGLSEGDVNMVSNLVTETLQHIERSVVKGRMVGKAFSIPSLPHSDDTSVMADNLVDSCLGNINQYKVERKAFSIPSIPHSDPTSGFASRIVESCLDYIKRSEGALNKYTHLQPTSNIVDFILEIVIRLQSELSDGNISNLSMAHFFQAISVGDTDMRTLEANAKSNLELVVDNIKQFRERSEYVHRILETYLIPNESDEVFGDPLKAIDSILVNVSSEILTKFVKATLQTILMGMKEEGELLRERSPSVFVLRSASLIIAENVIKEVLERINRDMAKSVHKIHGTISKKEIERAASRLLSESPQDKKKQSSNNVVGKKQSMSSVVSREIEDIVLETLHNIVSNLRLEQSIKSQKGSKDSPDSNRSQEIEDFVLGTLQNIVVDHQDRRSQIDMGVTRTGSKYATSSIELVTGESKDAMMYVNEVLQNVLSEMKAELTEIRDGLSEKSSFTEHSNVQTLIVEYLQRALADSGGFGVLDKAFDLFSPDDVKKVLLETIDGTILNIKENKFSSSDLAVLFETAMRFFDEKNPGIEMSEDDTVTPELTVKLLEHVKRRIESVDIPKKTLDRISSQLATLGMNMTSESFTPENIASDASVVSSQINELVQDVIQRMSEQLSESTGSDIKTKGESEKEKDDHTSDSNKTVCGSSSPTSDAKKDINYNRKSSVCSADSASSMVTSNSNKADSEFGAKADKPSCKKQDTQIKASLNGGENKQERKLSRRSNESRPIIRQSMTPSKMDPNTRKDPATPARNKMQLTPDDQLRPKLLCYAMNTRPKDLKIQSLKKGHPKASVKASKSEKKTVNKKHMTPVTSSSAYSKKAENSTKASPKTINGNKRTPKGAVKQNNKLSNNEDVVDKEIPSMPLELKSICGVHRTKICYKEQKEDCPVQSGECCESKSEVN